MYGRVYEVKEFFTSDGDWLRLLGDLRVWKNRINMKWPEKP